MLQDQIKQYTEEIQNFKADDAQQLEAFRLKFLVNKGIVKQLFEEFKKVSPQEKRALGQVLNSFKNLAEQTYKDAQEALLAQGGEDSDRKSVV